MASDFCFPVKNLRKRLQPWFMRNGSTGVRGLRFPFTRKGRGPADERLGVDVALEVFRFQMRGKGPPEVEKSDRSHDVL